MSARLNLRNDTKDVGGVFNFLSFVSLQQKFEAVDQCYSSVTVLFYLARKGKYILEAGGWADPKTKEETVQFWLFFLVLLHSLSLPYIN